MLNAEERKSVETADAVIVGGGVVGLAVARALARANLGRIILIERGQLIESGTDSLMRGDSTMLADRLRRDVDTLGTLGATRVIVCCMTVHAVFDRLSPTLRARMRSLVDLLIDRLAAARHPHLMLCTSGCRAAGVLQSHSRWPAIGDRVIWPDADDQQRIHAAIYALKRGERPRTHARFVAHLLNRYGVSAYIAGCTELHLMTEAIERVTGRPSADVCADPLILAAAEIAGARTPWPHAAFRASTPDAPLAGAADCKR